MTDRSATRSVLWGMSVAALILAAGVIAALLLPQAGVCPDPVTRARDTEGCYWEYMRSGVTLLAIVVSIAVGSVVIAVTRRRARRVGGA
jgi:hypothetical protein